MKILKDKFERQKGLTFTPVLVTKKSSISKQSLKLIEEQNK